MGAFTIDLHTIHLEKHPEQPHVGHTDISLVWSSNPATRNASAVDCSGSMVNMSVIIED